MLGSLPIPFRACQAKLSYDIWCVEHNKGGMGLGRIELPTSRLSGVRSNRTELQALRTGNVSNLSQMCQGEKAAETGALNRPDSASHMSGGRGDR